MHINYYLRKGKNFPVKCLVLLPYNLYWDLQPYNREGIPHFLLTEGRQFSLDNLCHVCIRIESRDARQSNCLLWEIIPTGCFPKELCIPIYWLWCELSILCIHISFEQFSLHEQINLRYIWKEEDGTLPGCLRLQSSSFVVYWCPGDNHLSTPCYMLNYH